MKYLVVLVLLLCTSCVYITTNIDGINNTVTTKTDKSIPVSTSIPASLIPGL